MCFGHLSQSGFLWIPIVDFSRPYVDYLNAKQEKWLLFSNESLAYHSISEYQLNETIPECKYLIGRKSIQNAEELTSFGYELYEGYQSLSDDGIYLSDNYLRYCINTNKIEGLSPFDLTNNTLEAEISIEFAKKVVGRTILCSKIVPGSTGELVICGIYKSNNKMGQNGKETAYENDLYEYKSKTHPYYFYSKNCR